MRAKARKPAAQAGPGSTIDARADREAVPSMPDWRAVISTWPEDWRTWWAERAAVREYDGNQARDEAEEAAYEETLEAMNQCGR